MSDDGSGRMSDDWRYKAAQAARSGDDAGQVAYQTWMDYRIDHDPRSNDASLWDAVADAVLAAVVHSNRGLQANAVEEIREAVQNLGPYPHTHLHIMARHRKEWPTLWAAIDRLLVGVKETSE
jgi:hypothetical protein